VARQKKGQGSGQGPGRQPGGGSGTEHRSLPGREQASAHSRKPGSDGRPKSALLAGRYRHVARLGLVLLPLLLVVLVEAFLRLAGVAAPPPLVVRVQAGTMDVYRLNGEVGQRYFPPRMRNIMPKPGFRIFPVRKPPEALRIFVLGESTTAGFPYHTNGSFASFLEDRLGVLLPGRQVEVINCAMTGINSYAVADFVRELRAYEPDLFVLYVGHNEYYGAFGPASGASFGPAGGALTLLREASELRIVRLLRGVMGKLSGPPEPVKDKTVMEAMAGKTGIRRGDPVDRAALRGFESNLRRALREAEGVPVVLCEVVANLRDQAPFGSVHREGLSSEETSRFSALLDASRAAGPAEALADIAEVVRLDSIHAEGRYAHARALDAAPRPAGGEGINRDGGPPPDAAVREYRGARDHDAIPFRAPAAVNEIIRRVAGDGGAILVPLENRVASACSSPAPGRDFFFEHVHPRLRGHQVIAGAIAEALHRAGRPVSAPEWRLDADLPAEEYVRRTRITDLDEELADQRIFHLTHKWPFPPDPKARYQTHRDPEIAALARAILEHRMDLVEAHQRLGEIFLGRGDVEGAIAEYQAVCKIFPVVAEVFARTGELLRKAGRQEEAAPYFQRAAELAGSTGP